MRVLILIISAVFTVALSNAARAFCGFYVAMADTSLFNRASQVVLVRDGNRTVITMANIRVLYAIRKVIVVAERRARSRWPA